MNRTDIVVGYILSSNKYVIDPVLGKIWKKTPAGLELQRGRVNKGYVKIIIQYEGVVYRIPIHKVIARQKYGDIREDVVIHHVNSDKEDNSGGNLELMNKEDHKNYHLVKRLLDREVEIF